MFEDCDISFDEMCNLDKKLKVLQTSRKILITNIKKSLNKFKSSIL